MCKNKGKFIVFEKLDCHISTIILDMSVGNFETVAKNRSQISLNIFRLFDDVEIK
jgi:hypothetical protein